MCRTNRTPTADQGNIFSANLAALAAISIGNEGAGYVRAVVPGLPSIIAGHSVVLPEAIGPLVEWN